MRRFEPIVARLDQMAPFVRELAPDVELRPGVTAADLYRMVANDRRAMRDRLATVRYALKLAAQAIGRRVARGRSCHSSSLLRR